MLVARCMRFSLMVCAVVVIGCSRSAEPARLRTRLLQVVVKQGEEWKVVAYHNVDVKPGTPVPEPRQHVATVGGNATMHPGCRLTRVASVGRRCNHEPALVNAGRSADAT